jgi:hypothetical protein
VRNAGAAAALTDKQRVYLQADLLALLKETISMAELTDDPNQSQICSRILNSSSLLAVIMWIEDHVSEPIDFTAINIAHEFDSMNGIINFIARRSR